MTTTERDQAGFSLVETLLVLVVIIVIGLAGWLVYKHQKHAAKDTAKPAASKSKTVAKSAKPADPYAGWKSFCSSYGGLCLQYPADWQLKQQTFTANESPSPEIDTVTSPSGDIVVSYTPSNAVRGTGNPITMKVVGVSDARSQGLHVVSLIDKYDGSGGSKPYSIENFVATNLKASNGTAFTTGATISANYEPVVRQFTPANRSNFASVLAVEYDQNDKQGLSSGFDTYDAAAAALNGSEAKTADQILKSAKYN